MKDRVSPLPRLPLCPHCGTRLRHDGAIFGTPLCCLDTACRAMREDPIIAEALVRGILTP
jgi:hypothetical protein